MQRSIQPATDLEPSPSAARPQLVPAADTLRPDLQHFARALRNHAELPGLTHQQKLREALLLIFCDPIPKECLRLWLLSQNEWQDALHWLDISGLALYFLGRLEEEHLTAILPENIHARLRQNLADNTARTDALLEDSSALHRSFQHAGLAYATLKGFSLGSHSVPRLELRSQLDLDFLVAESSAPEAQRILESRGFALRGQHRRSLEFAAHDEIRLTLRDLYKSTPHRWIELHIEPDASPILARARMQYRHNILMPVLNPVDLFLGQGLHIYKHLLSHATRTSHLIEFRRHILARSTDPQFWRELRARAEADSRHPIGLGVVIHVIDHLMGRFAPPALTRWSADLLPLPPRLWVEICAHDALFASPPSTKLYKLLHEALAANDARQKTTLRQVFLPTCLPRLIATAGPRETLLSRFRANVAHLRLNIGRTRFHLREGIRLMRATRRFRSALARMNS